MEPREFLNTPEGFAEIIEREEGIIEKNFDDIFRCEDAQIKGIQLYHSNNRSVILTSRDFITTHSLTLIFAKYSAGLLIEDIKKNFIVALQEKTKVCEQTSLDNYSFRGSEPFYDIDEYWEIMQMLALGILLDVNEQESAQLLFIRDKVATPDIILDFLCSYYDKRKVGFNHAIGDKYNGLAQFIKECTPENAPTFMKTYLSKQWFKDYKRQDFMTTHNSKYNIHSGYWSFESGAIMKILQADDAILKDQQFYPYDMVHWQ